MGHTHLTHNFLLRGVPHPYCEDCIVPLSIQPLLINCQFHQLARRLFEFLPQPLTIAGLPGDGGLVMYGGGLYIFLHQIKIYHDIKLNYQQGHSIAVILLCNIHLTL